MANEFQARLIGEGVAKWNAWRRFNEKADNEIEIDFSKVDFSHADLRGANFCGANLRGTNFSATDLCKADLSHANSSDEDYAARDRGAAIVNYATDFSDANLREANLEASYFNGADFRDADLSNANLKSAHFVEANFSRANLNEANLSHAWLWRARLNEANLRKANLKRAEFNNADLSDAVLVEANLFRTKLFAANLSSVDLSRAVLYSANLQQSIFVRTKLEGTIINDNRIFGMSAWGTSGTLHEESGGFIVTPAGEPMVTVSDLEVAQFVYLLLNNPNIRNVLDTVGKKGVLILGSFSVERKPVLDGLRDKLRQLGFVPMMFDFSGAKTKDFTETVRILAGMSRFIVADITNPSSSPLELQATVPDFMLPFVPIIQENENPFSMFADLQNKYSWVLDVLEYKDMDQLLAVTENAIVKPALQKEDELAPRKGAKIRTRHAEHYSDN